MVTVVLGIVDLFLWGGILSDLYPAKPEDVVDVRYLFV